MDLHKVTYLSLGWGVQSWTIAAMCRLGELPPIDAAIHGDTTHERTETYEFSARWTEWLEAGGVRVVTVCNEAQAQKVYTEKTDIPAFSIKEKRGMLLRQCTSRWKIQPMRQWISAELKRLQIKKRPGCVRQMLGISLDEVERMKPNDVKYIDNFYPLIEKKMTRADCVRWLSSRGLEVPPKSSCVFCPYHNAATWRELSQHPQDWQRAVSVDNAIRNVRPPFALYVHRDCIPLEKVDLRTEQERGQLDMFSEECSGHCFL